jgi:hypothetical protein
MTITNPGNAGETVRRDATEAARRTLRNTISVGVVAPESFAGKLRSQENLLGLAQTAFEKARSEAAVIASAARDDINALRREELKADPFVNDCLGRASGSVHELPEPLDTNGTKAAIAGVLDKSIQDACHDADRSAASRLKTRQGADRRRRRLRAEIDLFNQKLTPLLANHIAGLVRDELAGELTRRYEASERSQAALRRLCAEATDPGDTIPGAHRFSLGPRMEVVLKAAAARRPDLLNRDGRPADAIWPAFGAEVAGNLGVMEDPQEAIEALQQFLEAIVASALEGLSLDSLYSVAQVPPEAPSWISRAGARMQVRSPERPYVVRLAQVPAASSDMLYDHVLHHIEHATRGEEENRLQLMELTYSYCADEVLGADPRGLEYVLETVLQHVSSPRMAQALQAQLAVISAAPSNPAVRAAGNGHSPQGAARTPR